ncbi:hypothetical protein IWZ01DRAFT_189878 [Phyllosticta capitalensis]
MLREGQGVEVSVGKKLSGMDGRRRRKKHPQNDALCDVELLIPSAAMWRVSGSWKSSSFPIHRTHSRSSLLHRIPTTLQQITCATKSASASPHATHPVHLGRPQATPRPIGAHPAPPPSQPDASQRWRSATRPTGTNATQPPNRLRFFVRLLKPPVPKSCLLAFRACAWAWFQLLGWPAGWLALAFRLLSLAGWLGGRRCEG